MKPYLVRLMYQCAATPQYQEQWRFILADDAHCAYSKATHIGLHEGQHTQSPWQFRSVTGMLLLDENADGAECLAQVQQHTNTEKMEQQLQQQQAALLAHIAEEKYRILQV